MSATVTLARLERVALEAKRAKAARAKATARLADAAVDSVQSGVPLTSWASAPYLMAIARDERAQAAVAALDPAERAA